MILPIVPSVESITGRLPLIFPEGTANRNYLIRDIAVKTVFSMLYVNAIEGFGILCTPAHVYRMTQEQSHKVEAEERRHYYDCVLKRGCVIQGIRWYEDNTRESIRDETLRDGLIAMGVVLVDKRIPTTSSKPRYCLSKSFADLFNPDLESEALELAISEWQEANLSAGQLARVKINLKGASRENSIIVTFPNGETRHMHMGASSVISKQVIEIFAPSFLIKPFVLWLSESGNKAPVRDDELAKSLGLEIDVKQDLPDIILVDMGTRNPLLVFIEVVATDGAITERRKAAIFNNITDQGSYNREDVVFVSAYMDKQSTGFKKTITEVGWDSFIWFASEPDNIFILHKGAMTLAEIKHRFS
jgi:hypothetical protein